MFDNDFSCAEKMAIAHGLNIVKSAHDVTKAFEAALCEYTGAKYAVTTTSCTQAILMALSWWFSSSERQRSVNFCGRVSMPKYSYVGVPASILNAGCSVTFRDEDWQGEYQLMPSNIWDSARRFTSGMYRPGQLQCVSFHATKILADSQGGAILHDNHEADEWLRRARFDGRTEGVDPKNDVITFPSFHAYMSCDVSTRLLWKLQGLQRHNADLPRSDYGDLSLQECFK